MDNVPEVTRQLIEAASGLVDRYFQEHARRGSNPKGCQFCSYLVNNLLDILREAGL